MILRGLKWVNKLNILWSFRQGPPEIGVSIPQCTGLHRLWAGVEDAASPLPHTPGPVCGPQECCRRLPAAATPHQRPVTCTRTQITLCPLHADNLIHSCRPCVSIWSRGWSVTVPAWFVPTCTCRTSVRWPTWVWQLTGWRTAASPPWPGVFMCLPLHLTCLILSDFTLPKLIQNHERL